MNRETKRNLKLNGDNGGEGRKQKMAASEQEGIIY